MASSYFFLKFIKHKKFESGEQKRLEIIKNTYNTPSTKCRICLKEGSVPIYDTKQSLDISDAVKIFGDIEIDENDGLPNLLCDFCYSLLQGAILFRKLATETNLFLLYNLPAEGLMNDTALNNISNDNNIYDAENNVNNEDSFRCTICQLEFNTYETYLQHQNSKQHRSIRVQCRICKGLITAQSYRKHLARHKSTSHLICDVCGKLYRKDNLLRHLQLHSFELPYQCQVCPYRGRFVESLKIHMRCHTGNKPFSCHTCKLKFLTRSNLNRHLLTHKKDKPFKCIECDRGFYTQKDADVHFKSNHAGIKDLCCHICDNKYATRKALLRHELRVHKREKMAKGRTPLYLQEEFKK
ncbi:unnamed protein product [Chilo suppressalis]|uniref:Protein krueppel n=1 Tax=Chilo suppressalis TaxID=168631 RepID=A0ABN8AZ19_CHISP|nr:unnamed protein product [Chilo suppressalis]